MTTDCSRLPSNTNANRLKMLLPLPRTNTCLCPRLYLQNYQAVQQVIDMLTCSAALLTAAYAAW